LTTISVNRSVSGPPATVFEFLADLDNHSALSDDNLVLVRLDGPPDSRTGGVIELRGPLGLRRVVKTRLEKLTAQGQITGLARAGDGTAARVTWTIAEHPAGANVELTVDVLEATAADRLLLILTRRWLRRRLAATVDRLEVSLTGRDPAFEGTAPSVGVAREAAISGGCCGPPL
jgi:hypothetical protein